MDHLTYFRNRMLTEREAAARARTAKAADLHRELADRYEKVIRDYGRAADGGVELR